MTNKQTLAIVAIIVLAALISGGILMRDTDSAASAQAAHQEQPAHQDDEHHGTPDQRQHGHDGAHQDGEHHDPTPAPAAQGGTSSQQQETIALDAQQMNAAGIELHTAGPASVDSTLQLPGEVVFNQDRTAHVVPQVAGVVASVAANLGQQVKAGQVLAALDSSAVSELRAELLNARQRLALAQSAYQREKRLWEQKISAEQDYLQAGAAQHEAQVAVSNAQQKLRAIGAVDTARGLGRYEIRAPFAGTVVEKHLGLGEAVREDANVFLIADLSSVWVEISVAPRLLPSLRVGQAVTVRATAFEGAARGRITHVGALVGEQSRTAKVQVLLPNPDHSWRPGLFVNVEVASDQAQVPVAVAAEAIQTVDGKSVVFVQVPGGFVAQPVQTGRSDGKLVEIRSGLQAGASYAAAGSFAVKAELGKGEAEHAH